MSIYILLIIVLLILLLNRHNNLYNNYNWLIIPTILLALFLICVFRALSVGTDYNEYNWMFMEPYQEFVINYVDPGNVERGFAYLIKIAQISNNFLIVSSVVIIVDIVAICFVGKKFHVNRFTLISFFVITGLYFQSFTALRQMIAIGLVIIGICCLFLLDNHPVINDFIFILFILLAMSFHRTALFAIIFLILPKISYGKITVCVTGIITILLFITGLAQKMAAFLIARTPFYSAKYQGSTAMSNHGSFGVLLIETIPMIIQFLFLYNFMAHNEVKSKKGKFILSGYLLYLILLTGLDNNSVRRLQLYTVIFPILYSCLFLDGSRLYGFKSKLMDKIHESSGIISLLYIAFWVLLYFGKLLITDRFDVVPYSFIHMWEIHR